MSFPDYKKHLVTWCLNSLACHERPLWPGCNNHWNFISSNCFPMRLPHWILYYSLKISSCLTAWRFEFIIYLVFFSSWLLVISSMNLSWLSHITISNIAMNKTLFLFCSLLLIQSLQSIFSGLYVFYVSLPIFPVQTLYPLIFISLVPGTHEFNKSLLNEYLYLGSPA